MKKNILTLTLMLASMLYSSSIDLTRQTWNSMLKMHADPHTHIIPITDTFSSELCIKIY